MDGTLFLEGYKLKHRITLNLQKHTILLSHADMFTPTILFDMIERYFNKQNFSDTYQKSVHIRLNEKKLSPTDFQVWRIRPDVNVEEELKIAKKHCSDNIWNNCIVINRTCLSVSDIVWKKNCSMN